MCEHWNGSLRAIKNAFGCIPCLPASQRITAFWRLPAQYRHIVGVQNIHPVTKPARSLPYVERARGFAIVNRTQERDARRASVLALIVGSGPIRRSEILERIPMHSQSLTGDLAHLVRLKKAKLHSTVGKSQVYSAC
jgi:hypothetical protein